ncbi:hypothetical protein F4825DRAFT_455073 [Nemania diffusa]|nr:hypothetical protein F4825DRAFT_455073 [Nemania diffusa]
MQISTYLFAAIAAFAAQATAQSCLPNGNICGQRVTGFVYGTMAEPLRGAYAEYLVAGSSFMWAVPGCIDYRSTLRDRHTGHVPAFGPP